MQTVTDDRISPPLSAPGSRFKVRFTFKSIQTRLTVLYAALFVVVLLSLAIALQIVLMANARREVGGELQSSGAVFERLWSLQTERLQQGGEAMVQDFGFRQAVATGDVATVQSALANLTRRLKVDRAIILKADGSIMGGANEAGLDPKRLSNSLDPEVATSGIMTLNGAFYLTVAAPVLAPDPQGWALFALKLDRTELGALERTASIPLRAELIAGNAPALAGAAAASTKLRALVSQALAGRQIAPQNLTVYGAPSMVLVRRLDGLAGGPGVGLVLTYPLAKALAPYIRLRNLIAVVGFFGGCALLAGGAFVARGIARPVRALDAAARSLKEGQTAELAINGEDELARLAHSFNEMAETIRARETRITQMAYTDMETDLGNQRALEQAVSQLLRDRPEPALAVAVIAIDRFSQVRGAIGHGLAQQLVATVGQRLISMNCKHVSRLSNASLGFAIPCADLASAEAQIDELTTAMRAAFPLAGTVVDITVTAGLAAADKDMSAETVIEQARIAVDQAASLGARYATFDADAYGDPGQNLSLMSELMQAIGSDELTLVYQPKLDLRQGRVTGVEALTRWKHQVRGPLSPDLFITMAEETGHIREMTDWALDCALADQARLAQAGHQVTMSVNLSGRLLSDDAFILKALDRLNGQGDICLEITETAVINNPERAKVNIARLIETGVSISIDDYGSGLSSLAYLRDIHAHELKIDKAFVLRMDQTAKDALLVRSTVDMAHSLNLRVTAEGVETAATLALLTAMGCDLAQGYFIAKPMPLMNLLEHLGDSNYVQRPAPHQRETGSIGRKRSHVRL
jgi:EAL domain-containing protein (putative c-di-GMP-specific phosphodiesterase class I)/GGDEF domain-containing protein